MVRPLQEIAPALEEIADELKARSPSPSSMSMKIPASPSRYGVRGIPTLMLFKDGKMASSHVGASPKGELKKWITGAI